MGDTETVEPTGAVRLLVALIEHSETWGKVWFGVVFWGSVLFAVGQRVWPETATLPLLFASLALGLSAGIAAHVRGYWL